MRARGWAENGNKLGLHGFVVVKNALPRPVMTALHGEVHKVVVSGGKYTADRKAMEIGATKLEGQEPRSGSARFARWAARASRGWYRRGPRARRQRRRVSDRR